MSNRKIVQQSKFLSLILRHQPHLIGLSLDANGWADVEELIQKSAAHGQGLDLATIRELVATSDKQRFALNEDCTKIRANQGHSVQIDLGLSPIAPPAVLYHGTCTRFVNDIRRTGLQKRSRQHVHLSLEVDTARKVGARHGVPVILVVDAAAMHADGKLFYCSENGVWLTEEVEARYLSELG